MSSAARAAGVSGRRAASSRASRGSSRTSCPTSHAVAATIDEAIKAREEGKEKVILFSYSGHGLMDLSGYDKYMSGKLSDYELPEEVLQQCTKDLAKMPPAPMRKSGRW